MILAWKDFLVLSRGSDEFSYLSMLSRLNIMLSGPN
jgi:hypothetical protein